MIRSSAWGYWLRRARVALVGLAIVGIAWGGEAQPPMLTLEQTLDRSGVTIRGEGEGGTASVTFTIRAPEAEGAPLDLILALDRSASVDLDRVRGVAHTVVDHLSPDDRVGVVSFADRARLDQALTDDRAAVREAIDGLQTGRLTALGDGLRLAVDALSADGRSEGQSLVLLLTDGTSLTGRFPLPEADRAAENGVPVMAVGATEVLRTRLMHEIAQRADGVFYERFSMDVLESIFRRADRPVVARSLRLTETMAGELRYEGARGAVPSVLPGSAATGLEWRIPVMFAGEVWTTTYRLSGTETGTYRLHRRPSGLTYRDPSGRERRLAFPERLEITVESP